MQDVELTSRGSRHPLASAHVSRDMAANAEASAEHIESVDLELQQLRDAHRETKNNFVYREHELDLMRDKLGKLLDELDDVEGYQRRGRSRNRGGSSSQGGASSSDQVRSQEVDCSRENPSSVYSKGPQCVGQRGARKVSRSRGGIQFASST